jgi:ubiquinone/menaquinone biosynthesis C-methylase UbiE
MPDATGSLADLQHPWFARAYERISRWEDEHGGVEHRRRLLAPLAGFVIEVGAGNGRNFAHYPQTVESVVAVEPEASLRELARRAAGAAPVPVSVVAARSEGLPGSDGHYDAAVLSLVLCSIADPAAALAEVRRVLRPGGMLRFYEHVRSQQRLGAVVQDAVTPVWSRVAGGCHLNRDTAATIRAAGFDIVEMQRFPFSGVPHILGTARPA